MRPRRFDKQLQFVFMVISGLTILVGLASIGVNRFLILSQERVLDESIEIIQRSERVGLLAGLAETLAGRLALSKTDGEISRNAAVLAGAIRSIDVDVAALRQFLSGGGGDRSESGGTQQLVRRMAETARRIARLDAAIHAEALRLAEAGQRLAALSSDEADLARLRITAGIWQMYTAPAGQSLRPMLDELADVNFFAFERLGELSEAAATLTRLIQPIVDAPSAAGLAALRAEAEEALLLAEARLDYLPSGAASQAAGGDLALFAATFGSKGLIARSADKLSATAALADLSSQLGTRLAVLRAEATRGGELTRARMQERIAAASDQALLLLAGLVTVVLLALVAGYLVWRRTRQHVVLRLGRVAERMVDVARGEIDQPMPISGHDEIGRLEKALNVMRRRVDEAARLRRSLEAAVLARTADVVAEMRSANTARAEAEQESHAKTHFLARMSHEIRTPLNGVIGLIDLLTGDEADPARRARLETALTSARDLQAMTEDILAFSSGEESDADRRLAAFDPGQLARSLGDHLQVLGAEKGLRTVVDISDRLPAALTGDAARIRQVVVNLISNAVKYTDAGEARLSVTHRSLPDELPHQLTFTVADTGPGMTGEEMRYAFDIYGRTVDARRKGIRGVGLGLPIVRQLTDAMGGELLVSTAPGHGAKFSLTLRLAEGTLEEPAGAGADTLMPEGFAVLVVDDHAVNRLVARGYLERMGCAVTEAATGEEALACARSGDFGAILIDLGLPDMSGSEVAARIGRGGARLAILTAEPVRDNSESRARFGVDCVLTKPVSPRALAAALAGMAPEAPEPAAGGAEAVLREDIDNLGPELVGEIVAAFLADLAEALPAMLSGPDPAARRRTAHRVKGAASNFALGDLCAVLQRVIADDEAALGELDRAAAQAESLLRAAALRLELQLPAGGTKQ